MGLFSRSTSGDAGSGDIVIDDTLGQQPVRALAQPAAAGDVDAVASALSGAPEDLRALLLEETVAKHLPLARAQQWAEEQPDSPYPSLSLAAVLIELGQQARGHDQADRVGTGNVLDFRQAMADARRALDRAVQVDGADPTPWLLYLRTDKDPADPSDLGRHLDGLRDRSPLHVRGLVTAAILYGEKWHGAPGAARALAEDVQGSAPEGHDAHSVVAHVLREEWLYLSAFQDDRDAAVAHITSEDSRRWLAAAADRSVRSPQYTPGVETPQTRNAFAFTASLAGSTDLAREMFHALDGKATTWPWAILGDPAATYQDMRKNA